MQTPVVSLCILVLAGCGGAESGTTTAPAGASAADVAPSDPDKIRDDDQPEGAVPLTAAIGDGRVRAEISGWDVNQTRLELTARVDLAVSVPAGTFFAGNGEHQNMIVTETGWIDLVAGRAAAVLVDTACTNLHRRAPRPSDAFTIEPPQPKLGELAICLSRLHLHDGKRQAVIWQFTDKAGAADITARRELFLPRLQRHCDDLGDRYRDRCKAVLASTFAEVVASYFDETHAEADACLAAAVTGS
jgi:hypothetical protein